MARTCPFTPRPAYEEIREGEPVSRVRLPDGGWAWVVSRHEDVRTVLNDRRFSADRQHSDFPQLVKGEAASRRPDEERMLIAMDAPVHGPARKAVLGEFTVRRLEALRPRIQEIVDGQIDTLLAGPRPGVGQVLKALEHPGSRAFEDRENVPRGGVGRDHVSHVSSRARWFRVGRDDQDRRVGRLGHVPPPRRVSPGANRLVSSAMASGDGLK
ncbi:hypothetical protein [Nonomuraea sp. NPDC049625]|uniref:hypothetical protein n=1 Tax=Nonomuraea sp. NPDC049625 TaxID=3155775 RepID=UPI00344998BA